MLKARLPEIGYGVIALLTLDSAEAMISYVLFACILWNYAMGSD